MPEIPEAAPAEVAPDPEPVRLTSNFWEDRARDAKATAIAEWLMARRVSAELAATYEPRLRVQVATSAGQRKPSPATWSLVVVKLAAMEGCDVA